MTQKMLIAYQAYTESMGNETDDAYRLSGLGNDAEDHYHLSGLHWEHG